MFNVNRHKTLLRKCVSILQFLYDLFGTSQKRLWASLFWWFSGIILQNALKKGGWIPSHCLKQFRVKKEMNGCLKNNNNRRERKAQAGRSLTEKVKSVCAVVSSRQCVWVCEEGVTVWLTDWPTEAGRDERKVRRCQAELRNTHPTESTSTPVTEYGSEILTVCMSMK